MKINIHKSSDRGFADYGDVKSYHSFNFAGYFNPLREKYGVIRVLNDEILYPRGQIRMDDNKNLEMLVMPIKGSLKISSSDGYTGFLNENQAQLFSTGAGLDLSIENNSPHTSAEFLQIWLFPKIKNTASYSKIKDLEFSSEDGRLLMVAAPFPSTDCLPLQQDAYISVIKMQENHNCEYQLHEATNLLLVFVVKGKIVLSDESVTDFEPQTASVRDSAELSDICGILNINAITGSEILVIETPPD